MNDIEIVKKAQGGDQEAVSQILDKYKGFVIMNSRKFFLNGADREDLQQEGMIGLIKAIRRYDDGRNASFSTFASICIRRQIITAVKSSNTGKNKVLNTAVNAFYEGEEFNLSHSKKSSNLQNPENIFLGKEKVEGLKKYLYLSLSKMEKEIFEFMLLGNDYIEIAEKTGRKVKAVDNAIQRIKKKVKVYLESYEKFTKVQ